MLLWGLHTVLSGVLRAFSLDLRRFLGTALSNRFTASGAGLGLTALLQSSTATGLMTASLAADGIVNLVPALAIMLGANVGTTLIVQLLSFDISAVALILFVIGLITFRIGGNNLARALGRIAIGLGLILLALHVLLDTLAPAEEGQAAKPAKSSCLPRSVSQAPREENEREETSYPGGNLSRTHASEPLGRPFLSSERAWPLSPRRIGGERPRLALTNY